MNTEGEKRYEYMGKPKGKGKKKNEFALVTYFISYNPDFASFFILSFFL
jgi:hypothetical protein